MSDAPIDPHLIIIFGATGDLAHRKILPALLTLSEKGWFDKGFKILGAARARISTAAFRDKTVSSLTAAGVAEATARAWCDQTLFYQSLGAADEAGYSQLKETAAAIERDHHLPGNRVVYLALPLPALEPTVMAIGHAGLAQSRGWTRLVVEKPFGHDLSSAMALNRTIHRFFPETSVYRLDHFLGKETVQNLLVLRFANAFFEPIWNRNHIERVEITVAEDLGVEGRGAFYEDAGALRDIVQNHLTQLLSLMAMEPPAMANAEAVANEKIKVLRAIEPVSPANVVFGQYGAGVRAGADVPAYRAEPGVAPNSLTETFVAMRLGIANWRWQGVPFLLRTGKRLPRKVSRITVFFKAPPVAVFRPHQPDCFTPNRLEVALQPDEGFSLSVEIKSPGQRFSLQTQRMRFRHGETFGPLPEAYQTLLLDVAQGERTHFVRADEVEAAWQIYEPLIASPPPLRSYASGTWGPAEAQELASACDGSWHNP